MTHPRPPENVRAVMPDGTEVPVDCVYEGLANGTHRWLAAWTLPEMPVRIGMLPAHTSVSLQVERV